MAIRDGNFLRGIVGPVVCRVLNGKQEVKSRPRKVKQTVASTKSANTFGKASSLGGQIRESLVDLLNRLQDREMHNRLTKQLNLCLVSCRDPKTRKFSFDQDSFHQLADLDFNIKSPLKTSLFTKPEITVSAGQLHVVFPSLKNGVSLNFPKGCLNCLMKVSVSLIRLQDGFRECRAASQSLIIKKGQDSLNGKELVFEVPDGCLCVVSVFLDYFSIFKDYVDPVKNKTFSPAGIWEAILIPGDFVNDTRHWEKMNGLKFEVQTLE